MALKSRLGFGMMRLPVKNGNPTDFDYDELNRIHVPCMSLPKLSRIL